MHKPSGFSHGLIILIFLVLGAIGAIGYLAITRIYTVEDTKITASTKPEAKQTKNTETTDLKTYENKDYGFSFQYPSTWKYVAEFKDMGRDGDEGYVSVTSPSGAVVRFDGNFGGKGGSCDQDPSDTPHHTKNCPTLEILKITPLADKSPEGRAINLYQYKYTDSGTDAKSEYGFYVDSGEYVPTSTGPIIGGFFGFGLMNNSQGENIESHTSGGDHTSAAYFNSQQAKDTELVLKTFQLL